MANSKISQLPVAASLASADVVAVVQGGVTKQAALSLTPYTPAGTGAVATTVQAELRKTFYSSNYPSLQAALTAATGNELVIDANITITAQVTIPTGTRVTQKNGSTITANVSEIALLIDTSATNVDIDGLIIAGTHSRSISTAFSSGCSNIRVRNCVISGATLAGAGYTSGIFMDGVSNVWIENNRVKDCGAGIASGYGGITFYVSANTYLHIKGNRVESAVALFGIACFATSFSEITGNIVSGMKTGAGNNNGYGIMVYDNAGSITNDNVISNNVVASTEGTGIYVVDANRVTISNNVCKFNGLVQTDATLPVGGIAVNGPNCSKITVTGNSIGNCGKDGVVVSAVSTCTISGNSIANSAQHGVHLRGADYNISVTANTVIGCTGRGIFDDVTAKTNVSITGNSVYGCTSSGIEINGSTQSTISANTSKNNSLYGLVANGDNNVYTNNVLIGNTTGSWTGTLTTSVKRGNKYSSGASQGAVTLVAGAATVSTAEIQSTDIVLLSRGAIGGTMGVLAARSLTTGVSFLIDSTSGTDTGQVFWEIVH
jgi:parallel beta-helix repeat protein